jgi:hypothetical protein
VSSANANEHILKKIDSEYPPLAGCPRFRFLKPGISRDSIVGSQLIKRLMVWFFETVLEASLLSVVLLGLSGYTRGTLLKDLTVGFVWITTMFFSTLYLFTTAIARAVWRGGRVWVYPVIALALFFVHFEILNQAAGGIFKLPDRVVIRIAGAAIVLACTFAGTLVLQRWTAANSNRFKPQS